MNYRKLRNQVVIYISIIVYLMTGCNKHEPGTNMIVPIHEIPAIPYYASLPLTGTPWKLIGFGDDFAHNIKLAQPYSEKSFTITFLENGFLSGVTSTNSAQGTYEILPENMIKTTFGTMTMINESPDGRVYLDALKKVYSYQISTRGLILRYETNDYLLFKPIE